MSGPPPSPERPSGGEPEAPPQWQPPQPQQPPPPYGAPPPPPAPYPPPQQHYPPQYVYPPPGYGPPHGYPVVANPKTNGFAVASLVLGIVWVYWVGSILALVFGYIAMNQIDNSNGGQSGKGMAIAGIVLGWVGVAVLLLFILFNVLAIAG